jgi:hypothetical protein
MTSTGMHSLAFALMMITDESLVLYTYVYTAFVDLGRFFSFLIYTQSVELLGNGISPSQGLYLHTEYTHTLIHASSGIRTRDPSVRVGEDHAATMIGESMELGV